MQSQDNNDQEHRIRVRKSFLKGRETPQGRLEFLRDHALKFRHAMVRLRGAVEPGWEPRSNYAAYRSQKDQVRGILQNIDNEARELDKLAIFDFLEVD